MSKIKNWWIWDFCRSSIFIIFILFFGFFATLAYIGEKRKNGRNNKKVHVMQEDVLYIRPAGFEEKESNDTTIN